MSHQRCHAKVKAAPKSCQNKAMPMSTYCSLHAGTTQSKAIVAPAVLNLLKANPEVLQPLPMTPGDESHTGQYKVKEKYYERYKVQFSGAPFSTEQRQIAERWVYNYEMPAVTADLVVFNPELTKVLLILRGEKTEPKIYANKWAVPGGFMERGESATQAAIREFNEEVSPDVFVKKDELYHVYTATVPTRDVRQRTVSVVFTTIFNTSSVHGQATDVKETNKWQWFDLEKVWHMEIAFDHKNLISRALATHNIMKTLDLETRRLLQMASTDIVHANLSAGKKQP